MGPRAHPAVRRLGEGRPRAAVPPAKASPHRTLGVLEEEIVASARTSPTRAWTPALTRSPTTSPASRRIVRRSRRSGGSCPPGFVTPSPRSDRGAPTSGSKRRCRTSGGRPTSRTGPSPAGRGGDPERPRRPLPVPGGLRRAGRVQGGRRRGELPGAAAAHGFPASLLTDNGAVFTAEPRGGGRCAIEVETATLGIRHCTRPLPPADLREGGAVPPDAQEWLAKRDAAVSLAELQTDLDRFRVYYNTVRPHRAIGRRTPAEAFAGRPKAAPRSPGTRSSALPDPARPGRPHRGDHAAPQQPATPHRAWTAQRRQTGDRARRRPRREGVEPRRGAAQGPHPRSEPRLPTAGRRRWNDVPGHV